MTQLVHLTKLNEIGDKERSCDLDVTRDAPTITYFEMYNESTATWPLSDIDYIAYVDAGTRSNIAALATFGVMGLGARRSWTAITVSINGRQNHFLARQPAYDIRRLLNGAAEEAEDLKRKVIDGPPPAPGTSERPAMSSETALDELERLSGLY